MRRWGVLLSALAIGCSDIEGPGRLDLEIELGANMTSVTTGVTVEFSVQARGSGLQLLEVEYGDGARESIILANAIVVQENRIHAFSEPGSYLVTATIHEGGGDMASDTVRVEVTQAGDGQ